MNLTNTIGNKTFQWDDTKSTIKFMSVLTDSDDSTCIVGNINSKTGTVRTKLVGGFRFTTEQYRFLINKLMDLLEDGRN